MRQGANGTRLNEAVAGEITGLIDGGRFPPGGRLPSERALAEALDVSRVTVREALASLQALGRIDIRTGSGAYVRDNGSPPRSSAFDLTQARLLFESEAAALAAPDIDDATLDHLRSLLAALENSEGEEAADRADRDFHLAIAAATGNAVVRHVIESLWRVRLEDEAIRDAYRAVCSHDAPQRAREHADILEALRRRDAAAARAAMRRHFTRLMESMLEVAEAQALAQVRERVAETRQRYLASAV